MKLNIKNLTAFLLLSVLFFSCKKDEVVAPDLQPSDTTEVGTDNPGDIEIINQETFNLFKEVYLWYDELPESIDPSAYESPMELVDAIKFNELDRFSFVMPKNDFIQYFTSGKSFGHGFSPAVGPTMNVRIAFLYKNTEAYEKGVRRSWVIKEINNTRVTPSNFYDLVGPSNEAITNNFVFVTHEGVEKEISLTKEEVTLNAVLHSEVIEQNGKKIGYFVFQDFIAPAIEEIDAAFAEFQAQNIDELIIDLRYNGGGSVFVAEHIADWVLGNKFAGQPFYTLKHNDKRSLNDTTANVEAIGQSLNVNDVVFITTKNSASASEMLLNGFEPYVNTASVGYVTYGKPVGMEPFVFNDFDYAILPITFKYINGDGDGDFYYGIQPDVKAGDDVTKQFGDPQEASLQAALEYLSGVTTMKTKSAVGETKLLLPESGKGVHQFLRTE